ncbi:MAG: hypothetical protein K1X88_35840 [Nannocystaceae bacterium]|nr:hypothetical protein [Nannocystaceae bacterium]
MSMVVTPVSLPESAELVLAVVEAVVEALVEAEVDAVVESVLDAVALALPPVLEPEPSELPPSPPLLSRPQAAANIEAHSAP